MTNRLPLAFAAFLTLIASLTPAAAQCVKETWEGAGYALCAAPAKSDIRTFLDDEQGETLGSFSNLNTYLGKQGDKIVFAMNGGMYHPDFKPVGLFMEAGAEKARLNTRAGPGNFHLKPNGVFYVGRDGAGVADSERFERLARRGDIRYATQSGPMLVISGRIHPRIHEEGTSKKTRNGVGACSNGRIVFAISDEPVTFHEFATLFRDRIGCQDALFLDGSISALYAPSIDRHDRFRPMGPIVGLVEKAR